VRRKLGIVLVGIAAGLVVSAPLAFADDGDANGGHCSYGDFSVNVMPSCDTNGGGTSDMLLDGTHQELPPSIHDLRPVLDDLRPIG
jgi:hypothetical protein